MLGVGICIVRRILPLAEPIPDTPDGHRALSAADIETINATGT
jgi:hypothetical protein